MRSCPLCQKQDLTNIYRVANIPLFQNKVYSTPGHAGEAATGNVDLMQCRFCNFVFNAGFNAGLMTYDENYQNEQANSDYFQRYLKSVIEIIRPHVQDRTGNKKIIEIGCGKGFFLDQLLEAGFDVTGFDPAYEGDNPAIVRDYFTEKYRNLEADFIVLRHTLEHIESPLDFLHRIAKANNYRGKIYIEVPEISWIIKYRAFWDIFYEHCNYFSQQTLAQLFLSVESGLLFDDQYQYVIADLASLKPREALFQQKAVAYPDLSAQISRYQEWAKQHSPLMIWGAGAKGATFANVVDPETSLIETVIDINPKKTGRFIAYTGHPIKSPEEALAEVEDAARLNILVMNQNYEQEIRKQVQELGVEASVTSIESMSEQVS